MTQFACATDNDGFPQCQGDGSTCGPSGMCLAVIHPNMFRVLLAWERGEEDALELVEIVIDGIPDNDRKRAQELLRRYGVEPSEMKQI